MLPPIQLPHSASAVALRYFLAPMAGITDSVFRILMREMGADAVVSELVSAEGLVRGGQRTRELIQFDETERPLGIQIFGRNIASLTRASQMIEAELKPDFIDINLGCPVKKIVSDGAGAAWLKNPSELFKLLTSLKKAIVTPLTIKIRSGWDEASVNAQEIIKIAAECGVSWVAIHARTRAQGYSGQADWELIRSLSAQSPIPIIGNGDIVSGADAAQKLKLQCAHAIMIGRGALKNPWIFREAKYGATDEGDLAKLIDRHFALTLAKKGQRRAFLSLKKFFSWYATGLRNASLFRERLFKANDASELRQMTYDYFATAARTSRVGSEAPFLMGGHG